MAREETKSFSLRIPIGLKDQLEAAAELGGRTFTAEMVHRLRQSFAQAPTEPLMNHSLARIVATALVETERRCGRSAWLDTATATECKKSINVVFNLLLTISRSKDFQPGEIDHVGVALAALSDAVTPEALAGAVADAVGDGAMEAAYFARRLNDLRPDPTFQQQNNDD